MRGSFLSRAKTPVRSNRRSVPSGRGKSIVSCLSEVMKLPIVEYLPVKPATAMRPLGTRVRDVPTLSCLSNIIG